MLDNEEEQFTVYRIVVNQEEQYSIWPIQEQLPKGWLDTGRTGLRGEVLEYIGTVWTDMRPLSVRRQLEELLHNNPI
jgi:MbtH protein